MRNPEIWIILIIVGFLLFGAKKMPDAARGLGRSLRIFKAETKGFGGDDEHEQHQQPTQQGQQQIPAPQPAYQGQPYQGQPYQQQPYQGQPYQQQPYQGQPYQGQPYQGQPYQQQQPAPAVGQTAPADAPAERPQAQ